MAPKRLSENPPPAASSDEEEEESGTESETDDDNTDQNGAVHDDDAGDDEEDDGGEDEKESPVAKQPAVLSTPQKSDSATESDDSESTQPSPSLSAFTIKLHKPSKSATKRPAESDAVTPANKKSKSTTEDDEVKKGAIQRLWSEEDEIAILNGLTRYKSEKGTDPYADMGAFHEFIKKLVHVDVSKNQLIDKIRRLKKKYKANVERAEKGQDPVFAKSHDEKSFELSKKVWGDNVTAKRSGRVQNNSESNDTGGVTLGLLATQAANQLSLKKPVRAEVVEEKRKELKGVEKSESVVNFWAKYPSLSESLEIEGLSEGVKLRLREQIPMVDRGNLKDLDEKWKKLKQAELELFVQRMELVHCQVKLVLDSMKSSGS